MLMRVVNWVRARQGGLVKQRLYLLVAFCLGAIVTYGIISPTKHPGEWGVIVTTFGEGASLWGLFDSKGECFDARKAFIEEYGVIAGTHLDKKGSRSMLLKGPNGVRVMMTFSCLPLSDIRGLSLTSGSGSPRE